MNSKKTITSSDLWQIKILNSLIKKRHFHENVVDNSSLLLAPELLNSLLIRLKMKLNEKLSQNKDLLKKILTEGNLTFLESLELSKVEELMQLANYTDFQPVRFNNEMNLLKFIFEYKKHRINHQEIDFISNLWKTMMVVN